MMTPLDVLIHRMADELDHYRQLLKDDRRELHPLAVEARATLAQQEPEGLTDEEIQEWADACSEVPLEELDPEVHGWRRCFTAEEFSETIRAALARFGRPAPQPVADGEVGELVEWLREKAADCAYVNEHDASANLTRIADLLERQHPQPIPVYERLPGPEDCAPWPDEPDATPWAWAGKSIDGGFDWVQLSMSGLGADTFARIIAGGGWTHWLPAHALPLPTTET